jgi:hypothetical protein
MVCLDALDAEDASMLPLPNGFDVLAFAPELGELHYNEDVDTAVVATAVAARADAVVDW